MNDIVAGIARVSSIMSEIAVAGTEQTLGIEQVNTAIVQMDEVTQQNAALVEEAAAAASSMQDQALALAELVRVFNIGESDGHASPPAAPQLRLPAPATPRVRMRS